MAELFALAHEPALTSGEEAVFRKARDTQVQVLVSAKLIDVAAAEKILASPIELTAECVK